MSAPSNFDFLEGRDPELHDLATIAEDLVHQSPTTTLRELRTFGEVLVQRVLDETEPSVSGKTQHELLNVLEDRGQLPEKVLADLHQIRMQGNDASHENTGTKARAERQLRNAWRVSRWFVEQFHSSERVPERFEIPSPSERQEDDVRSELEALRAQVEAAEGRKARSKEVKRLEARIAELEAGNSGSTPEANSGSGFGTVLLSSIRRGVRTVGERLRRTGHTLVEGVGALGRGIRRAGRAVGRGLRRMIRTAAVLVGVGTFLLYAPTIYEVGVGPLPDEAKQSLPAVDTVARYHARIISPKRRSQIEAVMGEGIKVIRQRSILVLQEVQDTVGNYWTEEGRRSSN